MGEILKNNVEIKKEKNTLSKTPFDEVIQNINKEIPKEFQINLVEENENLYITNNEKNVVLNFPLNNKDELFKTLMWMKDLLKYDGKIQLIGGIEWRAIAEGTYLGGSANAHRIVNVGLKHGNTLDYYVFENNKIEEIFKFIQTLKGVPESKWQISESIIKSGPIGFPKNKIIAQN